MTVPTCGCLTGITFITCEHAQIHLLALHIKNGRTIFLSKRKKSIQHHKQPHMDIRHPQTWRWCEEVKKKKTHERLYFVRTLKTKFLCQVPVNFFRAAIELCIVTTNNKNWLGQTGRLYSGWLKPPRRWLAPIYWDSVIFLYNIALSLDS